MFGIPQFIPSLTLCESDSRYDIGNNIARSMPAFIAHFCVVVSMFSVLHVYVDANQACWGVIAYIISSVFIAKLTKIYQENSTIELIKEINKGFGTDFSITKSLGQKLFLDERKEKILIVDGRYIRCEHKSFLIGYSVCYARNQKTKIKLCIDDELHPHVGIDTSLDLCESFKWVKRLDDLIGCEEMDPCNVKVQINK